MDFATLEHGDVPDFTAMIHNMLIDEICSQYNWLAIKRPATN